jgi:hypothetical protein
MTDAICIGCLVIAGVIGAFIVAFMRWTLGMSEEQLRESDPRNQWNKRGGR